MKPTFLPKLNLIVAAFAVSSSAAYAQSAAKSVEIAPLFKFSTRVVDSHPAAPGTLATDPTPAGKLKPEIPFKLSFEPGYLPLRDSYQPLVSRYGAAPATVEIRFSRK